MPARMPCGRWLDYYFDSRLVFLHTPDVYRLMGVVRQRTPRGYRAMDEDSYRRRRSVGRWLVQ